MTLARRVQAIRARARIRRWEYRQRHLAHGAWGRFRLALALASEAHGIDAASWRTLVEEGFPTDTRGEGLEPARAIVWIPRERAAALAGARPLTLRLDAAMLASTHLALVAFPGGDPRMVK